MNNPGALDMALDDVISQNRKRTQRSTTSSRGGINKRRGTRPSSSPYNRPRRTNAPPTRSNVPPPRSSAPSRSNSLVVSNLHYNVTEKDLYDLFGQIGKLKRAFLHIGPNGKSAGIADVVFVNANDAERARVTYNNVQLDGRPMRITTASIISSVSAPSNSRPRGNNTRRPTRGGGSGRRENRPKPSQQDLDADMDSYMGVAGEDTQMN